MKETPAGRIFALYLLGGLAVIVFVLPAFLLGENCPVPVHDVFDAHAGINSMMYSNPEDGRDGVWDFLLGGLPVEARGSLRPVTAFFYAQLPPLQAYLADELFIRLVGFVAMFSLLLVLSGENTGFAWAVAVAFSFLPFYTAGGISVAGMPMVFLVALRLLSEKAGCFVTLCCLLFLAAFPFHSSLPLVGIFLIPALAIWWAINLAKEGKVRPWFILGVIVLGAGYLIANWPMIANTLADNPIVWHRTEFAQTRQRGPIRLLWRSARVFLFSHYHAEANPFPFLWLTVLAYVISRWKSICAICRRTRSDCASPTPSEIRTFKVVLGCFIFIVVSCLFHFLHSDTYFFDLRTRVRLFAMVNLSRWYFFFPLMFYVMLYYLLAGLFSGGKRARRAAVCLIICQIFFNALTATWFPYRTKPTYMWMPYRIKPTYGSYLSAEVFGKAENMIGSGKGDFKIACLGFHPSIAHLNGFKTIGGYNSLYPLEYKHRFRKIIAAELEKSEALRVGFDNYGSRCYLVSSELGENYYVTRDQGIKSIRQLDLDWAVLRDVGADYLFSAVLIENAPQGAAEYMGKSCDESAAIDLYVYKVLD